MTQALDHLEWALQRRLEDVFAKLGEKYGDLTGRVEMAIRPTVTFEEIGGLTQAKETLRGFATALSTPLTSAVVAPSRIDSRAASSNSRFLSDRSIRPAAQRLSQARAVPSWAWRRSSSQQASRPSAPEAPLNARSRAIARAVATCDAAARSNRARDA